MREELGDRPRSSSGMDGRAGVLWPILDGSAVHSLGATLEGIAESLLERVREIGQGVAG
jgi:hypothetical protein